MDADKRARLDLLQQAIDAIGPDAAVDGFREMGDTMPHTEPRRRKRGSAVSAGNPEGDPSPRDAGSGKAYLRLVDLCGYHDFACGQMRERLLREGFSPAAVDDALSRATSIGLIDDARWAEMRVCALMRKGMGSDGIRRDLARYGIGVECVEGWPHAFEERYGDEMERAMRMLGKGSSRSKNPRASAYARLVRKGFPPSIASRACAIWFEPPA